MLDTTITRLDQIVVHQIGNKTNNENLLLAANLLDTSDQRVRDLLLKYALSPFTQPEFHRFTFTNGDVQLNPLYNFVSKIFDQPGSFQSVAADIARHLYEVSLHPQIKSGDLFVAYFMNIEVDETVTNAVGIFKSENRQAFLKLDNDSDQFYLRYEDGISVEKMDKGCLIFNLDRKEGYKVCVVDKSNKSGEAQYWTESFLRLVPVGDEYHQTKAIMQMAKRYVTEQLSEEFSVTKADQIDLLNRSAAYFKSKDMFDKKEFEEEIFQHADIIESFNNFDKIYRESNALNTPDQFDISGPAVKQQSKIFKSVLKLDRNFHVYIHGNRDMIERGQDENGRKYYKLYFEAEE